MKNLITYLKALWGAWGNLQSSDVRHDCRRSDLRRSPSGLDAKWKQNPFMRFAVVLTLIFSLGVGNVWGEQLYFEGWEETGHHRSNGSNSYTSNSYGDWSLTYADAVSSGSPLTGSYHAILRVARNTKNSPSLISGALLSSGETITKVSWKCKGFSGCTLKVSYSTDGSTWTEKFSSTISTTAQDKNFTISPGITGPIYLKFIVSVSSSTTSNRDANIDNITIEGTSSGGSTPSVTPDPTSLSWGTVLQGSSQGNKTISITGANLTAGTLTISATGGYSVTPTSKSVSGTLDATTLTVTPPSTSTTGAKNGKVTISGGGLASNVEVDLSMTVNAASTVTWMVNGSEYTTTLVANGSKPECPSNPSSCDGTSTTFVGWTPTPWSGKLDDVSAKTIYTSGSAMPDVSGPVTYHAVFAKASGSGSGSFELNKDDFGSSYSSEESTLTKLSTNDIGYKQCRKNQTNNTPSGWCANGLIEIRGSNSGHGEIYNKTAISGLTTLRVYEVSGASNLTVYYGTSSKTTENSVSSPFASVTGTESVSYSRYSGSCSTSTITLNYYDVSIPSGNDYFYIYASSGTNIFKITVSYSSVSYSQYLTTCCTPLGSINGSVSWSNPTQAVVSWDNIDHVSSWTVKYKTHAAGDYSTWAGEQTVYTKSTTDDSRKVTITGLTPCTDYDFQIIANPASGYREKDQTIEDSQTHNWTVTKTGVTNVTAASLSAIPATTCASGFGPITIEAASGYALPADIMVTNATKSWNSSTGALSISNVTGNVSITITPTAASCASFSFHTGTGDDATVKTTNTTTCFSQVNSSTTWKIDNYVIPADTKFFVGDRGFFYDDNLGSNNSRSAVKTWSQEMFFEYTKAYGDGYRPTVGQATGAIGTLYIWSDNNWNNLHVGFSPQGYVFKLGSANLSMSGSTTLDADRYWETSVITLTSTDISGNYQTNLYTGSAGGVASNNTQSTAVNTMGVKTNAGDNWRGTAINDGTDANTRGFFRIDIGDGGTKNWHAHWVPTHRVVFHPNYPGGGGEDQYSVDVSVEETNSSIALASAPSAPTGYTFAGWYDAADGGNHITTARTISAGASANVELWAHWTANTIALTLDKNNNDASGSTSGSASVKYDNTALESGTTHATREHYTLEGYYAEAGCTHKVLTAAGALVNYTGYVESDKWVRNTTPTTLYANWTPANYTVTWYAGGTASGNITTAGNPSTSVAYNSKVTTLPTNPDGSPCDKTFVGWTNTTSYTHGTSLLFSDAAGSPAITGATNFYAVFAEDGGSSYVLVESDLGTDWAGDYLIAYSSTVFADGRVGGTGTGGMGKQHQKANPDDKLDGKVVDVDWGDTYHVTLEEISSNSNTYLLKTQDGLYNYVSGNSNGLSTTSTRATAAQYPITVTFTSSSDVKLGLGGAADGAVFRYNASEYFRYYANCTQNAVYLYKKTGGYTGHTINCADCGSSVTPTYTAAPTGGTVSVTKSASPVASGSTVKTCTAVDLTVTLTPATHYTLTGFTATGLSTGTATISPAVNTVVPTTSEQTFTVTVSAGATGTLNLTPTFTPETPLTITLSTNSKGTFTNPDPWPIYSGESFTFPDVTPNDPSCATFVGWIEGTTFVGDGTTHDAPVTIAAGSSSGAQSSNTTYTAVFYETETSESDAYVKVTAAPEPPATWANDHYLIVYEDAGNSYTNAVAFAGSRDNGDNGNIDATSNGIAVTIVGGNTIAATSSLAANEWRIAAVTGGYSIQSASGYYIGRAANSNGIDASNSTAYVNTIGYSDSRTNITSAGGKILKYNTAGDQLRFRYLTSAGDIQLYKLGTAVVETRTYTTNPSCTPKYRVTVASVTGGSPSADPKFNPESTTVTITANPSAGYSFTSWTITKTTGGDNVTSTLLTGDKPTTANTTFTMPAYDITIAATYAKKMVTELKVMDDETVVANTTGPVSGTLNVSTGANKTLDVVITPSDAFDHSWTATVSAGGTYASITNVTAEGFRVNGLAQGDATITVNAPNDGSAKSVTLTVQVRDIMPEEIILKRDGSNTPIETLIMYYDETNSKGQYVKVNVGYSPANPTNKAFTFSSALTGKVGSHSHAPASGYEVLVANGVTSDAVNCTFTSSADGSVTKVLAVTVLPILSDRFVDYVHGNATQTVSARLSDDRYSIIPDINTPSLSDASDSDPTSEDCETAHYHLVGWLPQTTAEALWAAGTPITDATEGLVRAGESVEATGQTWCAIWAEEAE